MRNENWSSLEDLYVNIHGSTIIHNSPKVETTHMSIKWSADKGNTVSPYDGILIVSKKRNISADIYFNMDKPQKHCLSEGADTKGCVLYDSISVKCPQEAYL